MTEESKIEILMSELYRFFMENGKDRPIEYCYGFFDAIGVIRDVLQKL